MNNELTGLTHAVPRRSESEALAVVAPHLTAMKREIMIVVTAAGDYGLTPDEHSLATGAIINTVRRRMTDLWKEGQIRPTDRMRKNARGNNETVWVVGRDEKMATTRETKDQKIKRLEAHVRLLIVEGNRLKDRMWHHAEHPYTHKFSENCGCESCAATRTFDRIANGRAD
jgi:hypothetical protein